LGFVEFSLLALVTAIAVVIPAELPDKTLIATLILTTRYRGQPVFTGVCAAFAVQCAVAAGFGSALSLLPERVVSGTVAVLFGIGAVMLLREGFSRQSMIDEAGDPAGSAVSFRRAALTSFSVLFAAEWGDASQLATAALTARSHAPLAVGLGAFIALAVMAGIGVLAGRKLRDHLPTSLLQKIAGFIFTGFALFALYETAFA
jgi:Ca2+/H+ antiporter, TMEM165/GDT1 family